MSDMGLRRERVVMAQTHAKDEDVRRVGELVDDYFEFVWRQLRRQGLSPADADDAAQEVFVVAARRIDSIPRERERSFLYGTALRVARNVRRGKRRRREDPETPPEPATEVGPEHEFETRRARALLDELLEQLPDELRRVLVLSEVEHLPASEVALLEHIPVGTVASRLRRAREQFRALLAQAARRNPFEDQP